MNKVVIALLAGMAVSLGLGHTLHTAAAAPDTTSPVEFVRVANGAITCRASIDALLIVSDPHADERYGRLNVMRAAMTGECHELNDRSIMPVLARYTSKSTGSTNPAHFAPREPRLVFARGSD